MSLGGVSAGPAAPVPLSPAHRCPRDARVAAPSSGCAIRFPACVSARGAGTGSGHPRASPRLGAGRWPSSSAPRSSVPRLPHAEGWGGSGGAARPPVLLLLLRGETEALSCPRPVTHRGVYPAGGRGQGAAPRGCGSGEEPRGANPAPAPHPGVAGQGRPHCGTASPDVGRRGLHRMGHDVGLAPHGTWITVWATAARRALSTPGPAGGLAAPPTPPTSPVGPAACPPRHGPNLGMAPRPPAPQQLSPAPAPATAPGPLPGMRRGGPAPRPAPAGSGFLFCSYLRAVPGTSRAAGPWSGWR